MTNIAKILPVRLLKYKTDFINTFTQHKLELNLRNKDFNLVTFYAKLFHSKHVNVIKGFHFPCLNDII